MTNTIIYFIPYVTLTLTLNLMVIFPWYLAIPLAVVQFLLGHIGAVKILLRTKKPNDMLQTPYYTAVFQSTAFLVGFTWVRHLVYSRSFTHCEAYLFLDGVATPSTRSIWISPLHITAIRYITPPLDEPGFHCRLHLGTLLLLRCSHGGPRLDSTQHVD